MPFDDSIIKIGHIVIVGSNSLVNKDMSGIPEGAVVGGMPAKLLRTGVRRVENKAFEKVLNDYFSNNKFSDTYEFDATLPESVCDIDSNDKIG